MLFRILIDDVKQPETQKAVLAVYAVMLRLHPNVEVLLTSQHQEVRAWQDVSIETARRMGWRLEALAPAYEVTTVFLPGHIIPGGNLIISTIETAVAAADFNTIADLDLFVVNNSHQDLPVLNDFASSSCDYEFISRYEGLSSSNLPIWLELSGLKRAILLPMRPWYSARSSYRLQWIEWASSAISQGLLDFKTIESDINNGTVRPSLLLDIKQFLSKQELPIYTLFEGLDAMFVPPESKLTAEQFSLLHSEELQQRVVAYAGKKLKQKIINRSKEKGKNKWGFRFSYKFIKALKRSLHFLRKVLGKGLGLLS